LDYQNIYIERSNERKVAKSFYIPSDELERSNYLV